MKDWERNVRDSFGPFNDRNHTTRVVKTKRTERKVRSEAGKISNLKLRTYIALAKLLSF